MAVVSAVAKDRARSRNRAALMESATIKEEALVLQARSGDLKSFSALVQNYQERAIRIAHSFVGNFEDARDMAQEAFVKAYENLDSFKEDSRFYTWFYRILVNTCKDFLRKKKVRRHLSFWLNRDGDGEDTDPVMNVETHAKNAVQELVDKELGAAIYKALDRLPLQQRTAFSLRYLEGLSLEEVSESMEISVGAVKATLWQAGQKMQKFLAEFTYAGG